MCCFDVYDIDASFRIYTYILYTTLFNYTSKKYFFPSNFAPWYGKYIIMKCTNLELVL